MKPCFAVCPFNLALSVYDRFAIGRSLVKLGNCYGSLVADRGGPAARIAASCLVSGYKTSPRPVAVDEHREATSGCAAVVKPCSAVCPFNLALSVYDRFAIGRSLVKLGNCYRGI